MAHKIVTSGERGWLYHPTLPDSWEQCPLYSMAEWTNGLAFRDIHFSPLGLPVIKIAEIKGGISGQTKLTQQVFGDSVRVRSGDLLFSWSGQPETSIDVFWWRGPDGWLNQHIFRVTPVQGIDPAFFYYLLRYLKRNFVGIARNKQTTGLGHVTKRDLENIVAAYPPLHAQHAIANILGALDDKIELNRQMSGTLEAMARALFKSWFIDFDPVRAKAEGRDAGLPPEVASLFPDRFVEADDDSIPLGWELNGIGAIADNLRQSARPNEIPEGTHYIALEHMPRKNLALSEWTTADAVESNKYWFKKNELLFGKLRPYFHKVGIAPVTGVCSTDILVLGPTFQYWWAFLTLVASSAEFVAFADRCSKGTKMPRSDWPSMALYPVTLPCKDIALAFDDIVRPMLEKIVCLVHESNAIAALRDALLPKLISGELRVKDAEQFAADAIDLNNPPSGGPKWVQP